MPRRNLASLMNTLSPPHAPARLVAPLVSLAPPTVGIQLYYAYA
jgi:hypothetical protein